MGWFRGGAEGNPGADRLDVAMAKALPPQDDAPFRAIAEVPDDYRRRRAYADWLERHCNPDRAALVRVQVELARLPADDPRRPELRERQDDLLDGHRNWHRQE